MAARDVNIGIPPVETFNVNVMVATTVVDALEGVREEVESSTDRATEAYQEWSWEMTDQLVEKLETIRLTDKAAGESTVDAINSTIQAISNLVVAQVASILSALQSLGYNAEAINTALDAAIEELKRTRRVSEFILGQEVEEVE